MSESDVLWVKLSDQIDAAFLDSHPEIRVICAPFTGLDGIDEQACQDRGIEILSLRGDRPFLDSIVATSELTIALILALLRRIPAAAEHVRGGCWNREPFRGRDLASCTSGIVGFGRVGQQVDEMLRGFGVTTIATNQVSLFVALGMDDCDIVTVHVPLNVETRGMCNAGFFDSMKPGAFFVNTSRGEVVDESALLAALESGHLAGAALDVVCNERGERNPRLIEFANRHPDRLIITPHIGGWSYPSCEMAERRIAEKLAEWRKGCIDH